MQGVEERNWGVYSKKTWPELNEILSKMNYKQRYEFTPPHGESLIDFEKRLNKVIQKIIIENPNRKVVLVSHGGAIRVMIGFLLDLPPEKRFVYEPPNASITILSYSNDIWETKLLLDTSHLG